MFLYGSVSNEDLIGVGEFFLGLIDFCVVPSTAHFTKSVQLLKKLNGTQRILAFMDLLDGGNSIY